MGRGLEAFNEVMLILGKYDIAKECFEELSIIEKELKDYYELLENERSYVPHSSSTALHDLHVLALKNTDRKYYFLPRKLANTIDKELKALEIIKKKKIDIDWFVDCATRDYDFIYEKIGAYNECVEKDMRIENEEEFNLLKEELLWVKN